MIPSPCAANPPQAGCRRAFASLAVVCLLGLLLPGAVGAQNTQLPDSGVTIRTTVQEVALDLVVRDSRGRLVKDLKADAVEVYEDGVRQEIRGFRLVPGREARQRLASESRKPGASRAVSAPRNRLRAVNLICIVYHNLPSDPDLLRFVLLATQAFLVNPLQPDTYIGVFRLDGRLVALYPFTDNRDELNQAAQNRFETRPVEIARAAQAVLYANPTTAPGAAPPSAPQTPGATENTGGIIGRMAFIGAPGSRPEVMAKQQFDQLNAMVEQLAALPGRKTVLLFSPGVVNSEEPAILEALLKKANAAQITIQAINANALNTAGIDTASLSRVAAVSARQSQIDPDPKTALENMRQTDDLMTTVRSTDPQAALRAIAEGTGGSLTATYDLKKPLERILEDVDTHYELTYRPASQKLDGHLRTIEVKLARRGLTVQSRTGYFAVPDLGGSASMASFESAAFAALAAEPRPHAFDFYSKALQFRPEESSSQYAVAFELPGANLTASAAPGQNMQRLRFSVLALVKDSNGQVVAKVSRDFPTQVTSDQLAALRGSMMTYAQPVKLPPGRYTVETAVVDREGARSSTNVFEIQSPPHKGIGLSDVVMVQRVDALPGPADPADPLQFRGKRVVPELGQSLPANAQPYAYFVVYPDKSKADKPTLEVQVLVDGNEIARQAVDAPAPDPSGAVYMLIRTQPHPGNCELRITAHQGGESVGRSVRYSIAKP